MALTKVKSRMIADMMVNALDYLSDTQITDVVAKTGSVDVSAGIQAAIDAAEARKVPIYFPAGTYYMTSGIKIERNEVHVIGEGSESTILEFNLSGGVAMDVGYHNTGGGTFWGWTIRDIQIFSNASSTETDLLKVNYPLNGKMERVKVDQANAVGLRLGRPQNFVMHSSEVRNSDGRGVIVENDFVSAQGAQLFVIDSCTIKNNGDDPAGTAYQIALINGAEHVITNSIIEGSGLSNIYVGTDLTKITNCSFEGTPTNGHIQIGDSSGGGVTSSNVFIGHNNFQNSSVGNAVDCQNYVGITIFANQFQSNSKVRLGSDEGDKYSIIDSNYGLNVLTEITDSGTTDGKIIYRNSLAGTTTDTVQTITDGDTTPDVRGINSLHTANSGATSITQFTGTASGDVFSVKFGDGNTTIVDGTFIVTATGSNLTPSSGDLITFTTLAGTGSTNRPVAYVINNIT